MALPDETAQHPPATPATPAIVLTLRRVALAILIVGLLASVAVLYSVDNRPADATAYQIIDGVSYPIDLNDTKSYNYNVERVTGKTGVFAADLDDWFSSLWHGRRLAYTIAFLSVVAALLCYLLAHWHALPPLSDDEPDDRE